MKIDDSIIEYIDSHFDETVELITTLAQIPSPSNNEGKRASFCKEWLERQGAEGVYIDEALNVIYPIQIDEEKPLAVFMAHTDVVFPDTTSLPLHITDGKIYCPGAGDDTTNLVILLMAAKFITEKKIKPEYLGVLFVCNSGEEGLGNLKGTRQIIKSFGTRICEFISFDGCNCMVTNKAVGSKRFKIDIRTEGGHSWSKFGNRNAIAYMASLINSLYTEKVPELGKTTYNVGMITGGTSVNTIAQNATMLYEFRSDELSSLKTMDNHLKAAIQYYKSKQIGIECKVIGDRPCMGNVDQSALGKMMRRTDTAMEKYFGKSPEYCSASTDCNIPFSLGIPSLGIGCYIGEGLHTRDEYVEIKSIRAGLKLAFELILYHFQSNFDGVSFRCQE